MANLNEVTTLDVESNPAGEPVIVFKNAGTGAGVGTPLGFRVVSDKIYGFYIGLSGEELDVFATDPSGRISIG